MMIGTNGLTARPIFEKKFPLSLFSTRTATSSPVFVSRF